LKNYILVEIVVEYSGKISMAFPKVYKWGGHTYFSGVKFLQDVVYQKLFKLVDFLQSYSNYSTQIQILMYSVCCTEPSKINSFISQTVLT